MAYIRLTHTLENPTRRLQLLININNGNNTLLHRAVPIKDFLNDNDKLKYMMNKPDATCLSICRAIERNCLPSHRLVQDADNVLGK